MTYYRLAFQARQTSIWTWKSTALTSVEAVFQLLRMYDRIPQDRIRVFTAASKEDLNEMLSRENNDMATDSVTAAEVLHARHLHTHEVVQSTSEQGTAKKTTMRLTAVATSSPRDENSPAPDAPSEGEINSLEKMRFEKELGPGGDHDTPYLFSLPSSTPQLLAWARLLDRVQRGELEP